MMKASQILLDYIAQAEGLILTPKFDVNGLAIGYGHHGPEVHAGLTWTTMDAQNALAEDVEKVSSQVESLVKVPLTQGQFDAIVDFTYNVGSGKLKSSTLLSLLNQKSYAGAAQQFLRWDNVNGKPNAGLLARRQWEVNRWGASC